MKKLIVYLCLLMLITTYIGCSKNDKADTTAPAGRYMEQSVEEPKLAQYESVISIIKNEKGNIEYYTMDDSQDQCKVFSYELVNGTYVKTEQKWCEDTLASNSGFPAEILLGEDHQYYLLLHDAIPDNTDEQNPKYSYTSKLIQRSEDGTSFKDITPSIWNSDEEGTLANKIQVSEEGILIYCVNYDPLLNAYSLLDDKEYSIKSIETGLNYCVSHNTLYYISDGNTELMCLDLKSQEESKIGIDGISGYCNIQVTEDGDIYLADQTGILHYKTGGLLWEKVVDGSLSMMSAKTHFASKFFILNGDTASFYVYYVASANGKKDKLCCYQFKADAPAAAEKEITIYSIWDNASIRDAILSFMSSHPGVLINYRVAMSDAAGASVTDMIKSLNTEILSGNGPDILLLDGLPAESYIEKNVLMDMSDILSAADGTLVNNIAKNFEENGHIYSMPMRFHVPFFVSKQDNMKDFESTSLIAAYGKTIEGTLFTKMSYKQLLDMFLLTYSNEIKTEDGKIDANALSQFLANIKMIADATGAGIDTADEGIGGSEGDSYFKELVCSTAFELLMNAGKDSNLVMCPAYDINDYLGDLAVIKELNGVCYPVKDLFVPNGIVSINKGTKQAATAKEFVQYLFSSERQSQHLDDGFPVNASSLEEWMNDNSTEGQTMFYGVGSDSGEMHMVEMTAMTKEQRDKLHQIIQTLAAPVETDYSIIRMISSEAISYLNDEKPLDQVIDDITAKVNLYLDE